MDAIDSLSNKVQWAARELLELKKERQQFISELEILRGQSRNFQAVLRENERIRREQDMMRARLIRLQKKIDKHLLIETTLAASVMGGSNEEHPQ